MFMEEQLSSCCFGIFVGECFHTLLGFSKKRTPLMKVYDEGLRRILRELDITKLIKNVKNMRTFIKQKFRNDPDLIKIEHHRKNVIFLDDSSDAPDSGKKQEVPF